MYDVLVHGGRVLSPSDGIDGEFDVAVSGGRVVAIEAGIDPSTAGEVVRARDCLVVPGLVDAHAHVYWGATSVGAWPDDICPPSCVTAVVDGGSSGSDNFRGFRRWIVDGSTTGVFCYVNLSRIGLSGLEATGELINPAYADANGVARILREESDVAVGIKVRLSKGITGGPCVPFLKLAISAATDSGRPLHLHIGDTEEGMAEVLALLRRGDMITHYQTPKTHGLLEPDGRVLGAAVEARDRGVLFDCGHGRTHFSFDVAAALVDQGLPPDTISTDVSLRSYDELAPPLITVMNKWLALGLPLADVIRATTSRPAEALQLDDRFGRLHIGGEANLALLAMEDGDFTYTDAVGGTRYAARRVVPVATLRRGETVWDAR